MSANGVWKGRTEATIEGLAKSLDSVHTRIDCLPCRECAAGAASVKLLWRIVLAGLVASLAALGILLTRS